MTTNYPPRLILLRRLTEATKWNLKNEDSTSYDQASQQSVVQNPALQHSATPYPEPRLPALQHPMNQHPALSTQQTRPLPHRKRSLAIQEIPSVPIPDVQEQSRQLRRILLCPADAYFDILSLANGTDMAALVEASWLNLSFLLHPKLCPLPDAVKALCRVNDAYAWIQRHPGLAQPHGSLAPMPHVAQATLPPPRASSAASSPRVDSAREPQQL